MNYDFHCSLLEWILKKCGQLLPSYLALQLAVEHMPECTDTASHVQTVWRSHSLLFNWYMVLSLSKLARA